MANLAAANVMHRKTRTLVSVLAVAMEVAMVMVLVGLASGTLGEIADRLQNVGADVLFQPPDASLLLGATAAVMPVKYIDIMKTVPGVVEATPVLNWHVSQVKGTDSRRAEALAQVLQEKFEGHKITPVAQVPRAMQENAIGLQQFKEARTGMAVIISFMVVLLAMYLTIIERTREIGILRAIGATQGKVVQYVVAESFRAAGQRAGGQRAVAAAGAQHRPEPEVGADRGGSWPRRWAARGDLPGDQGRSPRPRSCTEFRINQSTLT